MAQGIEARVEPPGRRVQVALAVFFCVLVPACCLPARAQTGSALADLPARIAQLQDQVNTVKSLKGLSKSQRQQIVGTYRKALSALQSAQSDLKQAADLRQAADNAPAELDKVHAKLHRLENAPSASQLRRLSADQLSQKAKALRNALTKNQSKLADLRDKLTRAAQRPDDLRHEIAAARNQLQTLGNGAVEESGQPDAAARAQRALVSARRRALNAKIKRLQQKLSGSDAEQRLMEAQRALAETRVAHDNEALAAVQAALGHEQNASAKSLTKQSESKLGELRGALTPISEAAQRNVELSHTLTRITQDTQKLSARQVERRARVDALERRLSLVQRQLEIGGASVALGDVLRSQRRNLANPILPFLSAAISNNVPDVAAAELQRFQLQQKRAALDDPAKLARQLADKAQVTLSPGQRESLVALLRQRRSIVDLLVDAESRYVSIGRDLQSLSRQYNDTLTTFNRLLDERLFWLPSFKPIDKGWPLRLAHDLPWIVNPQGWAGAVIALGQGGAARPLTAAVGVLLIGVLISARRRLRKRLRRLAKPLGNVSHDSFWLTLRVTLVTLLLALPVILILMLIGYLIQYAPGANRFTQAAGFSVFQLGVLALFIEPFVNVCRSQGLAHKHFQWPDAPRRGLHRSLRRLFAALIVPVLLISFTEAFDDDSKRETLGRAMFMLSDLSIAVFSWHLLHPRRGALADVLSGAHSAHWRLGYLWLPVAAGAALVLAGMAGWGYYYTAIQLQSRFFYSAGLLGGSVIVYSLIVRWLTVAERRLALARALRKREEAREARAAREAAAVSGDSAPESLESLEIDLVQISEQTRGLIKVVIALMIGAGLWLIWSGTLPALQALNHINLWHHTVSVDGQTEITNVTLGALLLALAVGAVTALAGRNLPGFLEITILRRFSLEPGSRYAVATLFQYAIVIIGLLVAVSLIGLHWSSIQWLVAALGVGLGFGLQEIFANFVSGIVILFERPIRVGDTVTVGALTGTVSRVRIRATTITDWDNKEIVIPNKTFITETVVNWTLTDDITRLVLHVGVSFDADGELVEKLIREAIKAEPQVLNDPAPSVFMVGFGDSSANYDARVYYHDLYYMMPLQHALYRRIHHAFNEHGIRIVFPQHDLHLRSVDDSFAEVFGRRKRLNDQGGPAPDAGGTPQPDRT